MRKLFSKVHLWLSIPLGIFITVVCLTGALLVFEDEINHAQHPELYYVENTGVEPMNPKRVAHIVAETLPEDVQVTGVTVSDKADRTWMVAISKPHHAAVAVNPYTGEVLGLVERSAFFANVLSLHRYLLNRPAQRGEMTVGKFIVGLSVLMLVVILITGIVLWWPRGGQSFGGRLKISCGGSLSKFWHQLHWAGGMYALIFVLLMALTGLTWSFGWYRSMVYGMFGAQPQGGKPQVENTQGLRPQGEPSAPPQGERPRMDADRPQGERPDGEAYHRGGAEGRPEHVEGEGRPERAHGEDRPEIKQGVGRPERPQSEALRVAHDNDRPTNVQGWIYWLHTGRWGGIVVKIIYFLAALIGAALPLTGYYMWWKRCRK